MRAREADGFVVVGKHRFERIGGALQALEATVADDARDGGPAHGRRCRRHQRRGLHHQRGIDHGAPGGDGGGADVGGFVVCGAVEAFDAVADAGGLCGVDQKDRSQPLGIDRARARRSVSLSLCRRRALTSPQACGALTLALRSDELEGCSLQARVVAIKHQHQLR